MLLVCFRYAGGMVLVLFLHALGVVRVSDVLTFHGFLLPFSMPPLCVFTFGSDLFIFCLLSPDVPL